MRVLKRLRLLAMLFSGAAVIYALNTEQSHGTFLGVPFDFRLPTVRRIKKRWWNTEDSRILTPHVFGVGWSLNLYEVSKRLGLFQDDEGAKAEIQD